MYYVLDDNKNLIEALSKEDVLGILEQAIEQGSLENIDEDTAVASKLRSIVDGSVHHIEFVTQAQFNALDLGGDLVAGTYYFITDDMTLEDLTQAISGVNSDLSDLESGLRDGTFTVKNAEKVNDLPIQQDENGVLIIPDAKTIQYEVAIGSELSSYDDTAIYEISGDNLFDGLILTYQGEQGEVNYNNVDDVFEILIAVGGAFENASGQTIITTSERDIIIPQKIFITEKTISFSSNPSSGTRETLYSSTNSLYEKTFEVWARGMCYKFKTADNTVRKQSFYLPNDYSVYQGSPNDNNGIYQIVISFEMASNGNALAVRVFSKSNEQFTFKIFEVLE